MAKKNIRNVKEEYKFKENGTFQSYYAATKWLSENGFNYGSMCRDMPIAITKRQYDLPEKYKNFKKSDLKFVDGWILSSDFREGEVVVRIFE